MEGFLILVAIVDGLIFGVLGLILLCKLLFASRQDKVEVVPKDVSVESAKKTKTVKPSQRVVRPKVEPIESSPIPLQSKPKEEKTDGLSLLISEARKYSKTCSVCGAYTAFFDSGRFGLEGMTSLGVMGHLDLVHKGKTE